MASAGRERHWLDVPFAQKDEAKAGGARWDGEARSWYAPREDMPALQRWARRPELPPLLPGEDRTFGSGLFVDLVPESCWFTNARSCIAAQDWDRVRRMVYARAGNRCEACGAHPDPPAGVRLEAHERWHYDEDSGIQALRRLVCLCSGCHQATHYGLARVTGHEDRARQHLMTVNRWDGPELDQHVQQAMQTWLRRNDRRWVLDLSVLTDAGVGLERS